MYIFRIYALAALCLAICQPVHAESGLVVSLASVGDRVRAQNPDLAAARLRIREAAGRLKQSGRLSNPELETSFQHNSSFRERTFELGFSQRFPITDRLHLEKKVSATGLKASEAEVREVERQLIASAREGVIKVLAIRERRDLLSRQSALSKEFASYLKEIADRGERSALDAGQARLEAASMAVEMRQLDAQEAMTVGELKPLLGMRANESVLVSGKLPSPVAVRENQEILQRPDYQVASLEVAAAEQQIALEQSKQYGDMEAGIFAAAERSEDAPDGYDTEGVVGLRVKIPLPLWDKNEGNIEEAVARRDRKNLEAKALSRSIRLEIEAARDEMTEWASLLVELNDTLVPLAEEQVSAAETAIREGQGEIQAVFSNRAKLLQLHSSRLDALREFNLARVRHQAALGKP